jgi:hypothetical protein
LIFTGQSWCVVGANVLAQFDDALCPFLEPNTVQMWEQACLR